MIIIKGSSHIQSEYSYMLSDESKLRGKADMLFFPEQLNEISGMFNMYFNSQQEITISGGRTGIVGGAVPEKGYIVSTERLKKIYGIEYDKNFGTYKIMVEAGLTLSELNTYINEYNKKNNTNLFFPVNVTEPSATIGGMVSTNASGSHSYKFGNMRNYVLALEVFLTNGNIIDIKRGQYKLKNNRFKFRYENNEIGYFHIEPYNYNQLKKNNAGLYYNKEMDFIDVFIGAEGKFGLIGQITLKLLEKDETILSIVSFFQNKKNTLEFIDELRKDKRIYAIEYLDSHCINLLRKLSKEKSIPIIKYDYTHAIYVEYGINNNELEGLFISLERLLKKLNSSIDDTWIADNDKERQRLIDIRHLIPEWINSQIAQISEQKMRKLHKISTDSAVPLDKLKEYMRDYEKILEESQLEYYVFGHIGDAHLHINIIPHDEDELNKAYEVYDYLMKRSVQLGGTISAEHGIGKIKEKYLSYMYTKNELEKMRKWGFENF